MSNANPLVYWAVEREKIRKAKESGASPPWTTDPILQTYKFTNLRRRDDRVSRWLRQHILTSANLNVSFSSFILFSAFCRWCNWPPVIEEILRRELYPAKNVKWQAIAELMDEMKSERKKVFTGAYMINAKGCAKGESKAQFIVRDVIQKGIGGVLPQLEKAFHTGSRQEVWKVLMTAPCHGSFMAGQCVDDWGMTILLSGAKDRYLWAPMGPGSVRGFNRVLGREPIRKRPSEEEFCEHLQVWRKEIIAALGGAYRDLSLMDCQNALCETDKMLRVKNGEGRPRSKYKPELAYQV